MMKENTEMFYVVKVGTNIRRTEDSGLPVMLDGNHIDSYISRVNRLIPRRENRFEKISTLDYAMLNAGLHVNPHETFVIYRLGTNEPMQNNGEITNMCEKYHLDGILKAFNKYGTRWGAMSIADYFYKFATLAGIGGVRV